MLGSINGYVLTKWRFPGSDIVFFLLLFGMFIPYQSVLIPLVKTLQQLHLYGSLWGLVAHPRRLRHPDHDAHLPQLLRRRPDGTGGGGEDRRRFDLRHLPPDHLPALAARLRRRRHLAVHLDLERLPVRRHVTSNPDVQPVTVALNNLAGSFIVEWNVQMAGALIAALPTLLVYILLGRFFMRGLMAGALSG